MDLINQLENLLKSIRLYFFFSILVLIFILLMIFSNPEIPFFYIIFAIVLGAFLLSLVFNNIWSNEAKKLIIKSITNTINIEGIDENTKILIKYSPKNKYSKNINKSLFMLIDEILLLNSTNKSIALSYLSKGFKRSVNIKTEDEIIIELNDNLTFEIIETFFQEEYSKEEGYGKNRRTKIYYIDNFKGVIISSKIDIDIIDKDYTLTPVVIYKNTVFSNPTRITFFKSKRIKDNIISSFLNSIFNIHELIDHKELYFEITEIPNAVYILHSKNVNIDKIKNITQKILERIYSKRDFKKSFIVIHNNIIYLFLSHEDNIFRTTDLFEVPFFLFTKPTNLEKTIDNFKNQLESILKLIL